MQRFGSVLVDIDATATRHPAFARACDLAARFGARVKLVDILPELPRGARQVMSDNVERELVERRSAALAALAKSRTDVQIDTVVLRGRPAIVLCEEVLRGGHDLVVRAHARDLKPGRLLGAVDMQLLRKCPCPVWLVGPDLGAHPPHVLAAVDVESDAEGVAELNETILELAMTIAEAKDARVTLLTAWSLYGEELLKSWMSEEELNEALEDKRKSATDALAALTAGLGDRGATVTCECVKGEPHVVIPQFVTERKVDLVVMGTVARTGIAGLLMGNTAENVLRQMRGSVLAVKPSGFVTPVTLQDQAERTTPS